MEQNQDKKYKNDPMETAPKKTTPKRSEETFPTKQNYNFLIGLYFLIFKNQFVILKKFLEHFQVSQNAWDRPKIS